MGVLKRPRRRGRTSRRRATRPLRLHALVLALVALGCGREDGGPGLYPAQGTVESVDAENAQVLIDHGDVAGLMPAMTMNFAVPDEALLSRLAPGQVVDFEIRFTGRSYEVASARVVGVAPAEAGWRRLGDGLVRTRPAPPFSLIDQAGRPVSLASMGDKVVVLDFIYTECPGPCPVQTANQVDLQRRLPAALRDRVRFVSISLDPDVDRPPVLERYATARGADLSNWSFLTGERAEVEALVRAYGVGSLRQPDGTIDHTLITFVVHDGRVIDHFAASEPASSALYEAIVALAGEDVTAPHAEPAIQAGASGSAAP